MPQTKEHILLARQVGIKNMVVFLNKIDIVEDEELIELVEIEIRELLNTYGFNGDKTCIVKGSALMAINNKDKKLGGDSIKELMKQIDKVIPVPKRELDKP